LKRNNAGNDPASGLVAVDFRAGLALLPFLPMSPADIKLIFLGLGRGSLVQFDRGNLSKLEQFVDAHSDNFADMRRMLDELKASERIYRDSVPDITHNHLRLLYSRPLWSTMLKSAVTGWQVQNIVDDEWTQKSESSRGLTILFFLMGLIPLLGTFLRRLWGRADWRRHYAGMISSWDYFKRSIKGKMAEKVVFWHRESRVDADNALKVARSLRRFCSHFSASLLPVGLHRLTTDWQYAKERLAYFLVRPVRLYFSPELREQWLREMVAEGRQKHILSAEDADIILAQVDEPFIQKYLKSLAVHVCTLPVTQIVSVLIAIIYVNMHPEMPRAQSWGIGLGIIALFQVTPISPGSLVRGFYVLYLVISERNFKDYNIAVFLGFFKYIGYLAFPIQMTYRYPVLARFMAGHWANETVHFVPVFGESGALLEHWAFCIFYNWPLTVRRRITKRVKLRARLAKRFWHIGLYALLAAGIFAMADFVYLKTAGTLPDLAAIWWLAVLLPLVCGGLVTLGCGGAALGERFVGAAACGAAAGMLYTALPVLLNPGTAISAGSIAANCLWRVFLFSIFSTIGAIATELKIADPDLT
jgi:hypothetical protein